MKFLDPSFIYNELGLNKNVPIFYMDGFEAEKEFKEFNPLGSKQLKLQVMKDFHSARPFDEMCMVMYVENSNAGTYHIVMRITRQTLEGESKNGLQGFLVKADTLYAETLMDSTEKENFLAQISLYAYRYILKPKQIVNLCETKARTRTKNKVRDRKAKVIFITGKKYFRTQKKVASQVRVSESFVATKVCGHRRNFYLETGDPTSGIDEKRVGTDRNGNPVAGWTYVRPYTRGEGAEIMNKIRIYK